MNASTWQPGALKQKDLLGTGIDFLCSLAPLYSPALFSYPVCFHRKQMIGPLQKCTHVHTAIAPSKGSITSAFTSRAIWVGFFFINEHTASFHSGCFKLQTLADSEIKRKQMLWQWPLLKNILEFQKWNVTFHEWVFYSLAFLFSQVTSPLSALCAIRSFWLVTCWRSTWKSTSVSGGTSVASAESCTKPLGTFGSTWGPTQMRDPTTVPDVTRVTRPRWVLR